VDKDPVLNPQDVNRVIERYQQRIAEHGTTFDSMKSGSPEKQRIRHEVHATALRGKHPSILDIGCGLGEFYQFLRDQRRDCIYTGYDIVPEYISACRASFPEASFEQRNIFEQGISGQFDTVIMSQVLNNRYQSSNNVEVMQAALNLAFQHTTTSVSVDMMSSYVDFESAELFYYSPEQILALAKSITKRVILRHDYRPFEFCIQLFHDQVDGYVA
jgi:SAM-dependent methyltransferase